MTTAEHLDAALDHLRAHDAHCQTCGFEMVGGRYVGLCPKCGSHRWYRTRPGPLAPRVEKHLDRAAGYKEPAP
jgi:anaerobic ribonucleoside-triphosphate reductase